MTLPKRRILSPKECDALLDAIDIQPILKSRVRQVRWLYRNCNKCTMVYEEKLVRLIVHRMQQRINDLEEQLANQKQKT